MFALKAFQMETPNHLRRYELDWLRVMVFALLIFYHVGMYFVPWEWHINFEKPIEWLRWPMLFLNQWRLPILFLISGMGTYFAFGKRSTWAFVKERFLRLFIPLVFGMLVIVPPQVYWERLFEGSFNGSYLNYWPAQLFNGIYPEGNFSWHHLWFLPYLFLFSVVLAPFFAQWIKRRSKNHQWGARIAEQPWKLLLFALPLYLCEALIEPFFPVTHALIGDWFALTSFGLLFLYGFLLASMGAAFWQTVIETRKNWFWLGVSCFSILVFRWLFLEDSIYVHFTEALFKVINLWAWILYLLGFAAKFKHQPSTSLSYANRAVYPFYILHQTVTLVIGYYLYHLNWLWGVKAVIMIAGTFLISWAIYAFVILPLPILHPFFGLKSYKKQS
jgi:hypothetical protein